MTGVIKPGRYVLDVDGVLHPLRRRYRVDVAAIVTVRAVARRAAPQEVEAIEAGGCAPPVYVPQQKIDLSSAPSGMEQAAASWKAKA